MTRGTLKKPASSAASGALRSAASRSSDGRTWSGRSDSWRVTHVRGRRDAGRVDRQHLVGVPEEVAELTREQLAPRAGSSSSWASAAIGGDLRSGEFCGHGKC